MTAVMNGSTTGEAAKNQTFESVACPFCGIFCDDLEIARTGDSLKVLNTKCERAVAGFERVLGAAKPLVGGRETDLAGAVKAAADILRASKLPLYGGLGTDVDGIRAVMSIADRTRGVVDHALSEGQFRNFKVLQTGGWFTTTLTETRNRADLFVVLGSDIHKLHPRFFERIVCAPDAMFPSGSQKRDVVFIGQGLDTSGAVGDRIGSVTTLACPNDQVGQVVAALRAMMAGTPLPDAPIAGVSMQALAGLLERIKTASYGVFLWAPPSLAFPNADLTVQVTAEFVKDLNKATGRYACLSLGGNEGAVSAGAVCAWQSGYPLRVSYASGAPSFDPARFAIPKLLEEKQGDALFWVASFTPDLGPPAVSIPLVVLGTPGLKIASEAAVFIPIGTPGVDHAGRMVRCDNVVSLPVKNLGRSALPSAATVIAAIEAAL